MHPSIERLLSVQDVDSQVIFLKEAMRLRPLELQDEERKRGDVQKELDALAARILDLRKMSDGKELEVKSFDSELERLNVALNQAKTNAEYSVLREQIRRQEERRGKLEEEILNHFAELETLEEEQRKLQENMSLAQKAYERKQREVDEVLQGLGQQLQELLTKRQELVQGIDEDHLEIYERVLARYNDFAVARVEGSVCQGCHMSVTPQERNQLMQNVFLQCRSCYRLIFSD